MFLLCLVQRVCLRILCVVACRLFLFASGLKPPNQLTESLFAAAERLNVRVCTHPLCIRALCHRSQVSLLL